MNIFDLRLKLKEFPFLENILKNRDGEVEISESIKVKRGDENLLAQTPFVDSYSWSEGGHLYEDIYYAVTGDDIVQLDSSGIYKTAANHEPDIEDEAPAIGEQLAFKNLNPDYIVHVHNEHDSDNGCYAFRVVVYKMKKFGFADYHCQQIDRAAAALKAEIRTVCEGGVR